MSRKLLCLLLAVLVVLPLGAAGRGMNPERDPVYSMMNQPFTRASAKMMAMGGAGAALLSSQDALYINPASLAEDGVWISLPTVGLTIYNLDSLWTGLFDIQDKEGAFAFLGDVLDLLIGAGANRLATIDAGLGFEAGPFALGMDAQVNLNTFNENGNVVSGDGDAVSAIPQVDLMATMGLGWRFFRDRAVSLDVGFSLGLGIRAFMEAVDAHMLIDAFSGANDYFMSFLRSKTPVAIGWSLPLSLGVNVNLPYGFTISNVVSNIGLVKGGYNYIIQEGFGVFLDDFGGVLGDMFSGEGSGFTAHSRPYWTLAFAWSPDLGSIDWIVSPEFAFDIVDLVGFFQAPGWVDFLARLHMGFELEILRTLELRAGLNAGYVSFGAGVDVFNVIHLEAAYYWNEFGRQLGAKPVDALTIRASIGWEP